MNFKIFLRGIFCKLMKSLGMKHAFSDKLECSSTSSKISVTLVHIRSIDEVSHVMIKSTIHRFMLLRCLANYITFFEHHTMWLCTSVSSSHTSTIQI